LRDKVNEARIIFAFAGEMIGTKQTKPRGHFQFVIKTPRCLEAARKQQNDKLTRRRKRREEERRTEL
jgi:hypothetical protein